MIWRKEIAAESPRAQPRLWIDRPQLPRIHFDRSRVGKSGGHGDRRLCHMLLLRSCGGTQEALHGPMKAPSRPPIHNDWELFAITLQNQGNHFG